MLGVAANLGEVFSGTFVFKADGNNAIWFTVVEHDLDNAIVLVGFVLDVLFDFLSSFRVPLYACQQSLKMVARAKTCLEFFKCEHVL